MGTKIDAQLDAGQVEIDHLDAVGEVAAEPVAGRQTPRAARTCAMRLLRASSSPKV